MKIIDATDLKVGRLASYVAKSAMNGETIRIVNADNAVVTGRKKDLINKYLEKRSIGSRYQGPFYPKRADRIVKRAIRGMLPYKKPTGAKAFKRIRTYIGVPEEFEGKAFETLKEAHIGEELEKRSYMHISELSKQLGAKE